MWMVSDSDETASMLESTEKASEWMVTG